MTSLKKITFDSVLDSILDYTPCDSPIEDIFYIEFQKYCSDKIIIHRQYECVISNTVYRLDFMIEIGHQKIGIECDGKNYHDYKKDQIRDSKILNAGIISKIYRLRGTDIVMRIHDVLDLIRTNEENLFSERGHRNIEQLSTKENQYIDIKSNRLGSGFIMREYQPNYLDKKEEVDDDDDFDSQNNLLYRDTIIYCKTN